ncbi:hypothetical protein COT48_00405 [Candidatus Woesearchaeota archaeon CG08_land_8_20_14_0_20_47_9]|nr:MAG: hypothetical protein COT48_00405 [Candidatus Woesearchaeota archaeon CG08_land_8_20_14_0_20_47_9]
MLKVSKDTTLEEVMKVRGAEAVLSKYKLPCLHCPMARMEMGALKLGEVCKAYGIDLKRVLEELKGI